MQSASLGLYHYFKGMKMENTDNNENPSTEVQNKVIIKLDTPIQRGNTIISELTIIRPGTPALRGTTLSDLLSLDVNSVERILPRITNPRLTKQEVSNMDPADLLECASKVAVFLLKREKREEISPIE